MADVNDIILEMKDIHKSFGKLEVLSGINLEVKRGEVVAIIGPSGGGKSTLLRCINKLEKQTTGEIYFRGKEVRDVQREVNEYRAKVGMVFQNPDNQIIGQIVEEDVGFGPETMGVPTKEIWERVEESLKAVGMYEYRSYSPNKLSGG